MQARLAVRNSVGCAMPQNWVNSRTCVEQMFRVSNKMPAPIKSESELHILHPRSKDHGYYSHCKPGGHTVVA